MQSNCTPETDDTLELNSDEELIGILWQAIEIKRDNIHTEVSVLSAY